MVHGVIIGVQVWEIEYENIDRLSFLTRGRDMLPVYCINMLIHIQRISYCTGYHMGKNSLREHTQSGKLQNKSLLKFLIKKRMNILIKKLVHVIN